MSHTTNDETKLSFSDIRSQQAHRVGDIAMLGAYYPCGDNDIDAKYVVAAYDALATAARKLAVEELLGDTVRDDVPSSGFTETQRHNLVYMGAVLAAKTITTTDLALQHCARFCGIAGRPDVKDAMKRYAGSRKVQVRRELKRAASSCVATAEKFDMSMFEFMSGAGEGGVAEAFERACLQCDTMGVSRTFIDEQRERLGLAPFNPF